MYFPAIVLRRDGSALSSPLGPAWIWMRETTDGSGSDPVEEGSFDIQFSLAAGPPLVGTKDLTTFELNDPRCIHRGQTPMAASYLLRDRCF